MAPRKATTILPTLTPFTALGTPNSSPARKPPTRPPITPTMMSVAAFPRPPLIIWLASQPAMSPTMNQEKSPMSYAPVVTVQVEVRELTDGIHGVARLTLVGTRDE